MGHDARAAALRREVWGGSIALTGLVLLAIPLYDVWDDVANLGWVPVAAFVENAPLLLLAGGLVGAGVRLADVDWRPEDVARVGKWHLGGTAAVAGVFALVVGIQFWAMNGLKPYVIVLDGMLIGSVAMFAAGVHSARSRMRRRELGTERDRFAGLFRNTTDAVAAVALSDDGLAVSAVNERFQETFDGEVERVFADALDAVDGVDRETLAARVERDETTETRFERTIGDGAREFVVRFVPYDGSDGRAHLYVVATDITDRQRLARQREANRRLDALHDATLRLKEAETVDEARTAALDAVEGTLAPDRVRLVLDGDVVATRGDDGDADREPTDADADRVVPVEDRGRIELDGDGFEPQAVRTVEVLATHLDRTLDRIDRERALAAERERLAFVSRAMRHNLLNDIQVVQGRLDVVEPTEASFAEHVPVIEERAEHMAEFVDTMRTYMQALVEGEGDLEPRPLRATLREEVATLRNAYPDATIEVDGVPETTVLADELLGPVFENLLTNAVEHNDAETPRVVVTGERDGDEVTVEIADNGPGIPDERTDALFERGAAGEASAGNGFGLYLVAEAADAYGGSVEVGTADLGGAAVRVTLPTA